MKEKQRIEDKLKQWEAWNDFVDKRKGEYAKGWIKALNWVLTSDK